MITKFKHTKFHPKLNDRGSLVVLNKPSTPSPPHSWQDSNSVASTVPNHDIGHSHINNIPLQKHVPGNWKGVEGQGDFAEPEFHATPQKRMSVGVVMVEPDKRVWVVHPSNQFAGYEATFPKGTVEPDLNFRENAIKETHEESGLKTELHAHLGDFERNKSKTRYYIGKRTGGHPSDMGWESQKVSLVPLHKLHKVLTHKNDAPIIDAIRNHFKDK